MAEFLKKFSAHTDYNTYINSGDAVLPNVSKCDNIGHVHYTDADSKVVLKTGQMIYIASSSFMNGIHEKSFIVDPPVTKDQIRAMQFNGGSQIIFPEGKLVELGDNAFYGCTGMTHIYIPEGVTRIGTWAFYDCINLIGVRFPSTLTEINYAAFDGTVRLASINIPKNVTRIDPGAFDACQSVKKVTVNGSNTVYSSSGNSIIEKATNTLIAGFNCTEIPSAVTSIADYAFRHLNGIKDIALPNAVTSIGKNAFFSCTALRTVSIGSGITNIGDNAFSQGNALESLTINATTPPTIGTSIIYRYKNPEDIKIYVPSGSVDTYKAAEGWSDYAAQIFAIEQ